MKKDRRKLTKDEIDARAIKRAMDLLEKKAGEPEHEPPLATMKPPWRTTVTPSEFSTLADIGMVPKSPSENVIEVVTGEGKNHVILNGMVVPNILDFSFERRAYPPNTEAIIKILVKDVLFDKAEPEKKEPKSDSVANDFMKELKNL